MSETNAKTEPAETPKPEPATPPATGPPTPPIEEDLKLLAGGLSAYISCQRLEVTPRGGELRSVSVETINGLKAAYGRVEAAALRKG